MGEQIIVMLGEVLPAQQSRQMISFSPPLKVSQLQTHLNEFADIFNRLSTFEMKIQVMPQLRVEEHRPDALLFAILADSQGSASGRFS